MKKPLREYLADLTEFVNVNRILRIGRRATKKAQEDNRRMGIHNVYSINGQLYYELPNGELTTEDPTVGQQPEGEVEAKRSVIAPPSAETVDKVIESVVSRGEASTETDESVTETRTSGAESNDDTIETPSTSTPHVSKNGAVANPQTPAAVSKPTTESDA